MATVKTNAGKAITAGRMIGATPTQAEPKFYGLGTGAGTAANTDTTLFTEIAGTRPTATTSQTTTTVTNDTYHGVATYTEAAGPRTITNGGNFDQAATGGGNLNVKGDFAASAVLQTGDSLQLTIDEKFA
jgi:hypothetical protein